MEYALSSISKGTGNGSDVTEFIMLGLTTDPAMCVPVFLLLLPVYIFTMLGNSSILLTVIFSAPLHKPMYFFLAHLSFLDMIFSSAISPKMLADLLSVTKTISFCGCIIQVFFFAGCAGTEFFLLAVMAFDRYVAICNPMLYTVTMTDNRCGRLVAASYIGGFLQSLIHGGCVFRLHFCGPNVMNHFVCDYTTLFKLSCTDVTINDITRFALSAVVVMSSLAMTFVSYFYIVSAILRIRTKAGRSRAASTCISHFTCVILYYGSLFSMEVIPNSSTSEDQYKVRALIPTVVIPALNPLIYSLRNNEVKGALKHIFYRCFSHQRFSTGLHSG